ncbi:MAG TPA: hypothetical protein VFW55_00390 [Propionicimonas sp.]|nr:hypothetical protein [Propionicimonas sp.]
MAERPKRLGERVVDGKTVPQKLLKTVGAAASALLAIGALAAGVWTWLNPGPTAPGPSPAAGVASPTQAREGSAVIRNQSADGDVFVQMLLNAAGGRPVQLDHKVYAPNTDPEYTLEYNCRDGRCAQVRLEPDGMIFSTFGDALWLKGCFRVTKDGDGYGAGHLDLALSRQGETCPV